MAANYRRCAALCAHADVPHLSAVSHTPRLVFWGDGGEGGRGGGRNNTGLARCLLLQGPTGYLKLQDGAKKLGVVLVWLCAWVKD